MIVCLAKDGEHGGDAYTVTNRFDEKAVLRRRPNPGSKRRSMRPQRKRRREDERKSEDDYQPEVSSQEEVPVLRRSIRLASSQQASSKGPSNPQNLRRSKRKRANAQVLL